MYILIHYINKDRRRQHTQRDIYIYAHVLSCIPIYTCMYTNIYVDMLPYRYTALYMHMYTYI